MDEGEDLMYYLHLIIYTDIQTERILKECLITAGPMFVYFVMQVQDCTKPDVL